MPFRQLIDDLGVDQGGIHIEGYEAPSTPKHGVALYAEVEAEQLGSLHEFALQTLGIGNRPAQADFNGHAPGDMVRQRQATGQTPNCIYVQPVLLHGRGNRRELGTGVAGC